MKVQTFSCERLGPRWYKTYWSEGATMFYRSFKPAKQRHDEIAASLPPQAMVMMIATFVNCPKIGPAELVEGSVE